MSKLAKWTSSVLSGTAFVFAFVVTKIFFGNVELPAEMKK